MVLRWPARPVDLLFLMSVTCAAAFSFKFVQKRFQTRLQLNFILKITKAGFNYHIIGFWHAVLHALNDLEFIFTFVYCTLQHKKWDHIDTPNW